jgi:hypothetical protein
MIRHRKAALYLMVIFGFLPLSAQPAAEPTEEEETPPPPPVHDLMLSFYISPVRGILSEDTDLPGLEAVYLRDMHGVQQVPLARGTQTRPIRFTSDSPPVLFTAERAGEDEQGRPRFRPRTVAELSVPPDWDRALILLYPERRDEKGHWTAVPVWNPEMTIPEGGVLFINSTPQTLVLEADGHSRTLESGRVLSMDSRRITSERYRLRIHGIDPNGTPRVLHSSMQRRRLEAGNILVLIAHSPRRVRVLSLRDLEAPPPPPEDAEVVGQ